MKFGTKILQIILIVVLLYEKLYQKCHFYRNPNKIGMSRRLFHPLQVLSAFRESMKLSRKKESTISELSTHHFYVGYPIFSQLKYPLFMLWTLTSIPYLFKNNCASIGRSRETPIGGIGETVLVSINIPFSRRCLLSLQAALPLFFTTILQSAIK